MLHRHVTRRSENLTGPLDGSQAWSLAVIDDVIARGVWQDWAQLRQAVLKDPVILSKVLRICKAYSSDPYAQRHHFWMRYVNFQQR